MVQGKRPDRDARLRVRVADPAAALHVADPFDAHERLQLFDLELNAAVHQGSEHLDLLLLVHPLLDHVERDGLVPFPPADERLEELDRRRRVQVRDQCRDAAEPEAVRRILLLPLARLRVDGLQERLVIRRVIDVRRVRLRRVRPHRLRVGINVLDQAELLVLLVARQDERHLLADVRGRFVCENPQDRSSLLQTLRHEQVDEDLLAYVRGPVDGRVRPERDAAEHEVVEARDPGLAFLLLHFDLELLLSGFDVFRDEALLPQPEFLHLLGEVLLFRPDLFLLRGNLALQLLEPGLEFEFVHGTAQGSRFRNLSLLRLDQLFAVQEVLLPSEKFFLFVGQWLFHFLDLVLLDLELLLQALELLFPQENLLFLEEDVLLLLRERHLDFRFRLAPESLGLRPDLVLNLEFADLLLEDDDPLLEFLFLREVVMFHFPELLFEPSFQLLARGTASFRRGRRGSVLLRRQDRLPFPEGELPLLQLPLVRLELPEPGFDLLSELLVHGALLRDLGIERLARFRLLLESLLELRREACFELLGLDVLDDRNRAFLDVLDLLLQLFPLRELGLELFR